MHHSEDMMIDLLNKTIVCLTIEGIAMKREDEFVYVRDPWIKTAT